MAASLPSQQCYSSKTNNKKENDEDYQICDEITLTTHKDKEHEETTPNIHSQQFHIPKTNNTTEKEEDNIAFQNTYKKYEEGVVTLPKGKGWMTEHLVQYQGFWLTPTLALKGLMFIQDHFKAQPTDIFLATNPKSGTTWLRALIFATINRTRYGFSNHPLLTTGPHDCFPLLENFIYQNEISKLDALPLPRLFHTHIPFTLLPESVTASGCKFVYICRNPKDVLVSKWVFMNKLRPKELPPLSLQEAFELFCEGISHYGPFWDQVLGYWKASLESPDKILFLKYEDMKGEPLVYVKILAAFLGQPFSEEEESSGVVQEIIRLCSFENLSNLEVNRNSSLGLQINDQILIRNRDFFRKGQVGDWENHLTAEMIECLDQITEEKFHGSGLTFDVSQRW